MLNLNLHLHLHLVSPYEFCSLFYTTAFNPFLNTVDIGYDPLAMGN
ncbi:hypothetical protein GXM_04762 [Nostoc sphaeroides CCNUC1]|uniref:Uncharacterized protein n=1 Tax=Nostoc sphaeroides CCNUC1 TaxID=2653204 RepID=A0A5P8W3Q0_9NOSO|nr:hypothetical protein GXM_04762 [Nostoc sphaeroides CCNUC1]